jgi:hypothetical protein
VVVVSEGVKFSHRANLSREEGREKKKKEKKK